MTGRMSIAVTSINSKLDVSCPDGRPDVRLGPLVECRDSHFAGPNVLERLACVNRCQLGGYSNIGVFSYVADAVVGRYCNVGARTSIGGFEHPQTWLGVSSYQWGKSAEGLVSPDAMELLTRHPAPQQDITTIGSDVWIGDNVVVKRGIDVGTGSIVGSGSVVTKDVPSFAIVVGNPARVLRYRFSESVRELVLASKWWERELEDLAHLDFPSVLRALEQLREA